MEYVIPFGIMFVIIAFISWRWVKAIDYMKENHPDYKGDDFLNWNSDREENENDKTQIL